MPDELFTVAQAAEYLKVCEKTIRRIIKANKLTAFRIGSRAWRIKKSDIEIYIKNNANDAGGGRTPDEFSA